MSDRLLEGKFKAELTENLAFKLCDELLEGKFRAELTENLALKLHAFTRPLLA